MVRARDEDVRHADPLTMLNARIPVWPIETSQTAGHSRWHRYTHRCLQALQRYGIDNSIAADAAQDAARWRARINRRDCWTRSTVPSGGRSGQHSNAEGALERDCWPRPGDIQHRALMRYKYNLVCEHCTYETQYHAWMVMHTERCHKAGHSGDPAAGAVAASSGSGAAAAGRSRPARRSTHCPAGGRAHGLRHSPASGA